MPACSTGRSEFYLGRRRRPLPENQTSEAVWPRRECPRSGSIGVKDPQSMASPRSRLVTWSYIHLSFHGRRFWRPHPDLDRAATPALPPGGGRPLCGGWFRLLAAPPGRLRRRSRKPFLPGGRAPGTPTFARRALGARRGARRGARWASVRRDGWLPGRVIGGLWRPFLGGSHIPLHRFERGPILTFE